MRKNVILILKKARSYLSIIIGLTILLLYVFPQSGFFDDIVYATDIDINKLISLTNEEREKNHLPPVVYNPKLQKAAEAKAEDMFVKDYWNHYGPNGETPWQFILGQGYDYKYAGENLAKNFHDTGSIHDAWMASQSHRENILNSYFTEIGIIAIEGTLNGEDLTIVVQMFGDENTGQPAKMSKPSIAELFPDSIISLQPPVISEPGNESILNTGEFSIRGEISNSQAVEIVVNNVLRQSGLTDQNSFSIRYKVPQDGEYTVYAVAVNDHQISELSNEVHITVDTKGPQVDNDSIRISSMDSEGRTYYNIKLDVYGKANQVSVITNDGTYPLVQDGSNHRWSGQLSQKDTSANSIGSYIIKTADSAGNETVTNISENQTNLLGLKLNQSIVFNNPFSRLFSGISLGFKINIIILTTLIGVLILDSNMILKHNIVEYRAKSLLHLPILIIFALLLLTGGGEIL